MKKLFLLSLLFAAALTAPAQSVDDYQWSDPEANLALRATLAASSSRSAGEVLEKANDGDTNTRWQAQGGYNSEYNDWVLLDFGQPVEFTQVVTYWEASNASQYSIYGSNNSDNIYSEVVGTKGTHNVINADWLNSATLLAVGGQQKAGSHVEDIKLSDAVTYQYLLIYCTEYNGNGTAYGSSIFEIMVVNDETDNEATAIGIDVAASLYLNESITATVNALNSSGAILPSYEFENVSLVSSDPDALTITANGDNSFNIEANKVGTFTLTANADDLSATTGITVFYDWSGVENLAAGKAISARWKADGDDTTNTFDKATDGNESTYYEYNGAHGGGDSWIIIDLGDVYGVEAVGVSYAFAEGSFKIGYLEELTEEPENLDINSKSDYFNNNWTRSESISRIKNSVNNYFPEVPFKARYIAVLDSDNPGGKPQVKEVYVKGNLLDTDEDPYPASLAVSMATDILAGESTPLTVTFYDQLGFVYTGEEVATVTVENGTYVDGKVTPNAKGTVKVTATYERLEPATLEFEVVGDVKDYCLVNAKVTSDQELANNGLYAIDGGAEPSQNGTLCVITENEAAGVAEHWVMLELEKIVDLDMIIVRWEGACSSDYEVLIGETTDNMVSKYRITGQTEKAWVDRFFGEEMHNVKFIKILSHSNATGYGLKIQDIKAYGKSLEANDSFYVYSNGLVNGYLTPFGWYNVTFGSIDDPTGGEGQVYEVKAQNGDATGVNSASMGISTYDNASVRYNTGYLHSATLSFAYYAVGTGKYTVRLVGLNEYNYDIFVDEQNKGKWNEVSFKISDQFPILADEWLNNKKNGNGYVFSTVISEAEGDGAIYFKNIVYTNIDNEWVAPEAPVVEGPETVPTPEHAAEDIFSFFTVYGGNTSFNKGSWGETTDYSIEKIDGKDVIKVTNFNYLGLVGYNIDVSKYAMMHVDYWTPVENTPFGFVPISLVPETKEGTPYQVNNVPAKQWNSYDVPLSSFIADMTQIEQIKFIANIYGNTATEIAYIANIYFYGEAKEEPEPGDLVGNGKTYNDKFTVTCTDAHLNTETADANRNIELTVKWSATWNEDATVTFTANLAPSNIDGMVPKLSINGNFEAALAGPNPYTYTTTEKYREGATPGFGLFFDYAVSSAPNTELNYIVGSEQEADDDDDDPDEPEPGPGELVGNGNTYNGSFTVTCTDAHLNTETADANRNIPLTVNWSATWNEDATITLKVSLSPDNIDGMVDQLFVDGAYKTDLKGAPYTTNEKYAEGDDPKFSLYFAYAGGLVGQTPLNYRVGSTNTLSLEIVAVPERVFVGEEVKVTVSLTDEFGREYATDDVTVEVEGPGIETDELIGNSFTPYQAGEYVVKAIYGELTESFEVLAFANEIKKEAGEKHPSNHTVSVDGTEADDFAFGKNYSTDANKAFRSEYTINLAWAHDITLLTISWVNGKAPEAYEVEFVHWDYDRRSKATNVVETRLVGETTVDRMWETVMAEGGETVALEQVKSIIIRVPSEAPAAVNRRRAEGDPYQIAQIDASGQETPRNSLSGIENVTVDGDSAEVYYNLQGIRVTNPAPGQIYIVNGRKVVLKF